MDTEPYGSTPDRSRTAVERPTTPMVMPPGGGRPSRRLPLRLLAALLLALAVLLLAVTLAGLRLWPSLPNPFASREVDRSQPVLLKTIEDLRIHKAASGNPLVIKGERTLFVAAGNVDAEVDFSAIDKGAIKVSEDRRSAQITLPRAHLTKAHV